MSLKVRQRRIVEFEEKQGGILVGLSGVIDRSATNERISAEN